MPKRRGYITGKRVTFRFYRSYRDIAEATRATIQQRLGKPGGMMRDRAEKHAPTCIVVYQAGEPIAWTALFKPGDIYKRSKKNPCVQVYVRPEHRRRGIGHQLLKQMSDRMQLWDGPWIDHYPESRAARKCFARAGFE